MTYAVPVDREHLAWLMKKIEKRCKKPDEANIARVKGQRDLEIMVSVADEDREEITTKFLRKMTERMKERTGIFAPVIYLEGNAPPPMDP